MSYGTLGAATDTSGPRVTWRGPAPDAPFCTDLNIPTGAPTDDVSFTVVATCEAALGGELSQEFSLLDILADV